MDAIRSEASTSLRGRAGGCPFFPFGILYSGRLHLDITGALVECAQCGEATVNQKAPPELFSF